MADVFKKRKTNTRLARPPGGGAMRLRVSRIPAKDKESQRLVIRCGFCSDKVEVWHDDRTLAINGVVGSVAEWRAVLLPLLSQVTSSMVRESQAARWPIGRACANAHGLLRPVNIGRIAGSIRIVPALLRLSLVNVGCWRRLRMRFGPRLNIIAGKDQSAGAVLEAILLRLNPCDHLGPAFNRTIGSIELKLAQRETTEFMDAIGVPLAVLSPCGSEGQRVMSVLRSLPTTNLQGLAVLLDDSVLRCLDAGNRATAVKILNGLQCQVILRISDSVRGVDVQRSFPNAKIFVCSWDRRGVSVHMTVRRNGAEVRRSPRRS